MRIQSGKPEMSSDAWAEGRGRGLACGLHVTACVHRLVHINILKKWKDLLPWEFPGCLALSAGLQQCRRTHRVTLD